MVITPAADCRSFDSARMRAAKAEVWVMRSCTPGKEV
jgi:hypothetical protein